MEGEYSLTLPQDIDRVELWRSLVVILMRRAGLSTLVLPISELQGPFDMLIGADPKAGVLAVQLPVIGPTFPVSPGGRSN